MQLLLAYSLPQNPTVKASISVVTTYYVRVSDAAIVRLWTKTTEFFFSNAAVVSAFISTETETSSISVTTEVCILFVDVG
jgi:hypothetical protein